MVEKGNMFVKSCSLVLLLLTLIKFSEFSAHAFEAKNLPEIIQVFEDSQIIIVLFFGLIQVYKYSNREINNAEAQFITIM